MNCEYLKNIVKTAIKMDGKLGDSFDVQVENNGNIMNVYTIKFGEIDGKNRLGEFLTYGSYHSLLNNLMNNTWRSSNEYFELHGLSDLENKMRIATQTVTGEFEWI